MCILRNMAVPNLPYRDWRRYAVYAMCAVGTVVMKVFPPEKLHKWVQNAAQQANGKETLRIGNPFGLYPRRTVYQRSMVFPLQKLPFEDMYISMPNRPEEMLRMLYGDDYMTPPPEGKRSFIIPYRLRFGDEDDA